MQSELAQAFDELLDVNDAACGKPQFVRIEGIKHRAIVESIATDEMILIGGFADRGGFRAQVRKSDFGERPEENIAIQNGDKGEQFVILSLIERNGVTYEITAGDQASGRT